MQKLSFSLFLILLLVACKPVSTPAMPTVTQTASPIPPTDTIAPTPTNTPSPIPVDLFKAASDWSPEAQAKFQTVLNDPWRATAEEKSAFDRAVIYQWDQTLGNAGVAHPADLQGYDLLKAIVEYALANKIHEVWLPISMHKMIITDQSNVFVYGEAPSSVGPFENLHDSQFGFGSEGIGIINGMTPLDMLYLEEKWIASINFYGDTIQRTDTMGPVTIPEAFEGILALRFFLPGRDPNKVQGILILMYDSEGNKRYAETLFTYNTSTKTTERDTCEVIRGNLGTFENCAPNISLPQANMSIWEHPSGVKKVTRSELDYLMDQDNLHLDIHNALDMNPTFVILDGMSVTSWFKIWSSVKFSH